MNNSGQPPSEPSRPILQVPAGEDRYGDHRGLGISTISFKVVPQDSPDLFVIENSFRAKGGPARHLHFDQDEWFFALEGEFLIEVGEERFQCRTWGLAARAPDGPACLGTYR